MVAEHRLSAADLIYPIFTWRLEARTDPINAEALRVSVEGAKELRSAQLILGSLPWRFSRSLILN